MIERAMAHHDSGANNYKQHDRAETSSTESADNIQKRLEHGEKTPNITKKYITPSRYSLWTNSVFWVFGNVILHVLDAHISGHGMRTEKTTYTSTMTVKS